MRLYWLIAFLSSGCLLIDSVFLDWMFDERGFGRFCFKVSLIEPLIVRFIFDLTVPELIDISISLLIAWMLQCLLFCNVYWLFRKWWIDLLFIDWLNNWIWGKNTILWTPCINWLMIVSVLMCETLVWPGMVERPPAKVFSFWIFILIFSIFFRGVKGSPPGGIESSCWGRKSSREEGEGKREDGKE